MKSVPLFVLGFVLPLAGAQPDGPRTLLDEGYRQMYNLQFTEAHKTFEQWQTTHPGDPMGPVSDAAAYLYSEFDRLKIFKSEFFATNEGFFSIKRLSPDPGIKQKFEAALAKAAVLAKKILDRSPRDPNARFAEVLRTGLFCALSIFSQIGQHREQHETAHEGQRVIEAQRLQRFFHVAAGNAAMPVHRSCTDGFDAVEQRLPAIGADHITQQPAQVANVGVLRDSGGE